MDVKRIQPLFNKGVMVNEKNTYGETAVMLGNLQNKTVLNLPK